MKRNTTCFLKIFFLAVLFFACCLFGSDMELELESGITVLLHDDHTWDYTPGATGDLREDLSIILDDGNSVKIKTNKTWYYLDKAPEPATNETEYMRTAYSVGTAKGPDLFDVKTAALDNAALQLAKQLLATSKKKGLTLSKLQKCIEEEDKKVDITETQSNDMWSVKVNMSIETDQIRFILDCAQQRED